MVLAIAPAVGAALLFVLAIFAPVSARRGGAFTTLVVCFALLAACALLGLYLYVLTAYVVL